METTFFKIKNDRIEYLGERYFKLDAIANKVVQVSISNGDTKKGKSNTIGCYLITSMTFYSNYLIPGYLIPSTELEFREKFDFVINMLR